MEALRRREATLSSFPRKGHTEASKVTKIISRLWSHVTDLRMLIREQSKKTLKEGMSQLDATEYYCRPYADVDDMKHIWKEVEDMEDVMISELSTKSLEEH